MSEFLGVPFDDVTVHQGDTNETPYAFGTGGSRSGPILGAAIQGAAQALRAKVTEIAAHMLEAAPDDIDVVEGVASVRGTPTRSCTVAEIAHAAYLEPGSLPPGMEPGLEVLHRYTSDQPFVFSNACHVCTVEIDPHTGAVALLRYIVSEDCGVMINPSVVEGQIAGGAVQGIGGALLEDFVYDEQGNPLTSTFMDYLLPTATDVPEIEYGHVETPASTPGHYKGVGEGGAIGAPAAVANAVNDALALVGTHVCDRTVHTAAHHRSARGSRPLTTDRRADRRAAGSAIRSDEQHLADDSGIGSLERSARRRQTPALRGSRPCSRRGWRTPRRAGVPDVAGRGSVRDSRRHARSSPWPGRVGACAAVRRHG